MEELIKAYNVVILEFYERCHKKFCNKYLTWETFPDGSIFVYKKRTKKQESPIIPHLSIMNIAKCEFVKYAGTQDSVDLVNSHR